MSQIHSKHQTGDFVTVFKSTHNGILASVVLGISCGCLVSIEIYQNSPNHAFSIKTNAPGYPVFNF